VNLAQCAFDFATAFEDRCDLRRGDAGTAAVGQPEVTLVEGRGFRGVVGIEARIGLEELERQLECVLDLDATAKSDQT
jgi:hypothetical protein